MTRCVLLFLIAVGLAALGAWLLTPHLPRGRQVFFGETTAIPQTHGVPPLPCLFGSLRHDPRTATVYVCVREAWQAFTVAP